MFQQLIYSALTTHCHSDAQLLDQFVRNHSEAAFNALVRKHGGMVWAVCRSQLSADRHAAEDATQATFLALAMNAGRIHSGTALPGWLHRVAVRACHDLRRRRRITTNGIEAATSSDASPLQTASDREREQILHEELDRLPSRFRLPMLLTLWNGHSNAEVAQLLDCAVGTVESRLTRARQRLRKRLTQRGVTPIIVVGTTLTPGFLINDLRANAPATVVTLAQRLAAPVLMKQLAGVAIAATMLMATAIGVGLSTPGNADEPPQSDTPMSVKENPLPQGALARLGSPNLRHDGAVWDVVYTPDGKQIISCGDDRTIRIWDNATGKQLQSVERRDGSFFRLFAQEKQLLAVGEDANSQCDFWKIDIATGIVESRTRLDVRNAWSGSCKFDHDGKRLGIVSGLETVSIYDSQSVKKLRTIILPHTVGLIVSTIAFDPTGKEIAIATTNGVHFIDASGKQIDMWNGIRANHQQLVYSTNGKELLRYSTGAMRGNFHLEKEFTAYDRAVGNQLWSIDATYSDILLCTPDGKRLITSTRNTATAAKWSRDQKPVYSGKAQTQFKGMVRVKCSTIHPNGKTVAFGTEAGTISQFDVASGKPVTPSVMPAYKVDWLRFSPDGKTLFGWGGDWYAWDINTRRQQAVTHTGWNYGTPLSPTGTLTARTVLYLTSRMVSPDDPYDGTRFEIMEATTGKILLTYPDSASQASGYSFTPDEDNVITIDAGSNPKIKVRSVVTAKSILQMEGHENSITSHALSHNGKVLVTVSGNWDEVEQYPVRAWDITTGKQLAQFPGSPNANGVTISADGQRIAISFRFLDEKKENYLHQIQVWDVKSKAKLFKLDCNAKVEDIAIRPDGKVLAVAIGDTITLHDVDSGAIVKRFQDKSKIISIAYSPDGKHLASSSWQAPVMLWDVGSTE